MHPRNSVRWLALLVFIFIFVTLFFLFTQYPATIIPWPRELIAHDSSRTCPQIPPHPSLTPPPSPHYDWRQIKSHYPVQDFAQLPLPHHQLLGGPKTPVVPIQYNFQHYDRSADREAVRMERQAAVKATFTRAWSSYKSVAWMEDELTPISGSYRTTFGGWGATLVDSLDTLWIMNLTSEFEEAVRAVTLIDFGPGGHNTINMFETTIRYLGGLIAAYDLTDCRDERLLNKAMELGEMVYASFDTPNRMPVTRWNPVKASEGEKQEAAEEGIIAELASFSLEFTRLSQLTGDMKYYDAVKRVADVLSEQQSKTKIPGMWPVGINVRQPDLTQGEEFSVGTMADSAYEYLAKTYQILPADTEDALQYKRMYESAMEAIAQHLLFRPMVPDQADILMPQTVRASSATFPSEGDHVVQHLVCFVGGMFALGGRLVQNRTHVDIGRKVTDGCIWSYKNAVNGIMPEFFSMTPCPERDTPCPYDETVHHQHPGFEKISNARYHLRPEAIESVFYMYRITGDPAYQDVAWDMFQAIDKYSRTAFANAALEDVMRKPGEDGELEKRDEMESFWLAETLKYFYLVFAEPDLVSLDQWVFNTEAHPFRLVR